jgi:phage terminase large subunit GpA-like protein
MLRVSEWAREFRKLSPESAATPGPFDPDVTPFMREIADSMGDPKVAEVRVMKSSQVAYSENLNNFIGRQVHLNAGPIMMIQPTLEMAESYSKDRISPMIRDSPALAERIDDRSRTSGNTILSKHFPGGLLQLAGSNSPASLASRPIRDVIIDEEDRRAGSAGKEGDPEKLAKRRQTTFHDAKLIAGGTPVLKGASKSDRNFHKGDQRRYQVPCPCCSEHISLEWENLQKNPEREHYAEFQCPKCEGWIEHKHKARMVRDHSMGGTAYWLPTEMRRARAWNREKNEWTREPEPIRYEWNAELDRYEETLPVVRSYYVWAAYSPFITWRAICEEYNEAKSDPELLQTFYNTIVGQPYEYTQNDLDPDELHRRAEEWQDMVLPRAVRAITAGVDTQNDRFEVSIIGWGRHEEAFVIEHLSVDGDPEDQDTRARLYQVLTERRYKVEGDRMNRGRALLRPMEDEKWLRKHLDYYNMHLKVPRCLNELENQRAISWFKTESKMISRVWDLAAFMDSYDLLIESVNCRSPGMIVYEDGHQIVAIPSRKGGR